MHTRAISGVSRPAPTRRPAARHGLLALALLALWLAVPSVARAEEPPRVDAAGIQNLFPNGVLFTGQAFGPDEAIAGASLRYHLAGSDTSYHVAIPIEPAGHVRLSYYWDTRAEGVPPGAQISAYWEVSDAAGRATRSAEMTLAYEDTRFAWQVTQNERAAVWWHDAPAGLGPLALGIANQALEYQQRIYASHPAYPVRIMLYDSQAEFSAWQPNLPGFVGGRGYPPLGVVALAMQDGPAGETWLRAAIPHELARLHFHTAAYHPLNPAPLWLDEGLAVYTELTDHQAEEQALQMAVVRRGVIPLGELVADFGTQEGRIRLAQAQGLSAVRYLMQTQGPEKVVALLRAYRDGVPTDHAFNQALGLQPEQFEEGWLIWLGVPKAWRPPPAAWRTPDVSATVSSPTAAPASATPPGTPAGRTPTPTTALPDAKVAPANPGATAGLLGVILLPALAVLGINFWRLKMHPGAAGPERQAPGFPKGPQP